MHRSKGISQTAGIKLAKQNGSVSNGSELAVARKAASSDPARSNSRILNKGPAAGTTPHPSASTTCASSSNSVSAAASKEESKGQSKAPSPNIHAVQKPLKSDPKIFYQLIGECYVDGMMNGEALSRLLPSVLFEIR
ncbi:hypothetical protein F4813DRAFT_395007 [Daldinia decipiens]|uniref:uncharacterized protein n=1 Tax=Daldinia decipiens TaxID=326647 RepID=UPI0020C36D0F|nr:uncharacterized protein F4813DRAFT_395007 [Daldinia decipiens]KAI1662972.1 hypothetical protein F4813DRAFT_395007 [Daldinia decipiens]